MNKIFRLTASVARKCVSDPGEALLMARMAWWVSVLSAAARLCPLPRALEIVSGRAAAHDHDFDSELPLHFARSIDTLLSTNFLHFKPTCWKRAAVLRRYLSKHGIATIIQFGVRNDTVGRVDGHAWLELDGKPFLEAVVPKYVVTYTFPSDKPYPTETPILTAE